MRPPVARALASFAAIVLSVTLPAFSPLEANRQAVRADPPPDLRNLFATGYILQDRNDDDVIDFVDARIVLPASPTDAEVTAAANIAARLGYETSASNLDLARSDADRVGVYESPAIVIGSRNALVSRAGADVQRRVRELAPGQGAAILIPAGSFFRRGGVLLAGNDATGLLAVSEYVAGRYPSIWAIRGTAYAEVPDRIARYLGQREARADSVVLDQIVIDSDRRGVARATVRVRMADTGSLARAARALAPAPAPRDSAGTAAPSRDSARADSAPPAPSSRGNLQRADLQFTDLHRVDVELVAGRERQVVPLVPQRPWQTRAGAEWQGREFPDFTLSDLYTTRGLYRDTNQDLVPDRMEGWVSLRGGESPASIVRFAERIGLETAGMRFPLVGVDRQEENPQEQGFPITWGLGHYQRERLAREGKLHMPAEANTGSIEMVKGGFGGRHGLVVGGRDSAGLAAIGDYVATRMPYLWDHGKGNYRLADVETDVRRFFQAREAPGQTALAMHKLGLWLDRLNGKQIDSLAVELSAKERYDGLDAYVDRVLRARFPGAKTAVTTRKTGFGVGKPIFDEDLVFPWEVDVFWGEFRRNGLPRIGPRSRGRIEVRVSESPEIRNRLAQDIRRELGSKGLAPDAFDVIVLSAYKQGYSWLHDEILPRLDDKPVARVEISYHNIRDSREVRWQQVESDTRWLQEIYPIDAVMVKRLGIPDSAVVFVPTQRRAPIYTVRAIASDGSEILRESFDPTYVVRPFFDLFPEYESVRVTTGWAKVVADGETLVDTRIRTDPETFWDHLQKTTYKRLVDYVMDVQEGRPSPGNAPYFDEFRVELTMSEPNYRIGVDEEVISSLEALHEDIYFETLTLFDLIGGRYGVGSLDYPGRVLPLIRPSVDGRPGRARITLTGKDRAIPELSLWSRERGKEAVRQKYPLSPLAVEAPRLRGISARAGEQGLGRLLFEVVALDSVDRYEQHKARGTDDGIDRSFLPVPLFTGMARAMTELHRSGIAQEAMSFDRVGELAFRFTIRDTTATFTDSAVVRRSARPKSTRLPVLLANGWKPDGRAIVQWNTPIPPAENDSILARLATFPGVDVYWMSRSFLGKNIFAADFLPPTESRFVSQAKLNALKPTVFFSGRQHANEVSSTSHILRLGELLATDTSYAKLLKKVNVVLHPITNADGAQVAYDMQRVTPDFMLHAGYLGALGVDATTGGATEDPIYPESQVRPRIQEAWLPDIYINMHGYPSHEWVQYFAGYSAWVQSRMGGQRSWWTPRGWFIPGFSWFDDRRNPEFGTAQFAILDSVAKAITAVPAVDSMNKRLYARYQKYGKQDVENFREYFHNGVLVMQSLRGREVIGTGVNSPRVTYFSITTEAPDETARGKWLELVASAGLAHSSALIRYLASGVNDVRRESGEFEGVVTRSVARRKPVVPAVRPSASGAGSR